MVTTGRYANADREPRAAAGASGSYSAGLALSSRLPVQDRLKARYRDYVYTTISLRKHRYYESIEELFYCGDRGGAVLKAVYSTRSPGTQATL